MGKTVAESFAAGHAVGGHALKKQAAANCADSVIAPEKL